MPWRLGPLSSLLLRDTAGPDSCNSTGALQARSLSRAYRSPAKWRHFDFPQFKVCVAKAVSCGPFCGPRTAEPGRLLERRSSSVAVAELEIAGASAHAAPPSVSGVFGKGGGASWFPETNRQTCSRDSYLFIRQSMSSRTDLEDFTSSSWISWNFSRSSQNGLAGATG